MFLLYVRIFGFRNQCALSQLIESIHELQFDRPT